MRKVVFAINMTADGYCGHTDGIADAELHVYFTDLLRNAGVLLSGRVTYELMVPFWPDVARNQSMDPASNEFARIYVQVDKVVFSKTLTHAQSENTRIASASPADELLALKGQPGKDIFVGSLSLASQLSDQGLIDEYYFLVHPVVAGRGPRLFADAESRERLMLELLDSKTFKSGVIALHYKKKT